MDQVVHPRMRQRCHYQRCGQHCGVKISNLPAFDVHLEIMIDC